MLKLSTLVALFICLVYSSTEHNFENQLPSNGLQHQTEPDPSKNTFQSTEAFYTEEKKSAKPCKQKQPNYNNPDDFKSLPITASIEQTNTASTDDGFVMETIHGANYNADPGAENIDINVKNCGYADCGMQVKKKVIQFESLSLDSRSDPLKNTAGDKEINELKDIPSNEDVLIVQTSEHESIDHKNNHINKGQLDIKTSKFDSADNNDNPVNNDESGDSVLLLLDKDHNRDIGNRKRPCSKGLNINTRRNKCGKPDFSEKISSRRILPGIIDDPTYQDLEDNKLVQGNPNSKAKNEIENRNNYFPNIHKISNSYDIDLVNNMNINDAPDQSKQNEEDSIESQLIEPTRGKGIYDMKDAGVMLLENSRVCYACSTLSDPTCWSPDRRTTVKYCRKGHKSCLTKSFKHKGKSVIIRDCGSQCVNYSGEENYSSCSICHSDVCNGASSPTIFKTSIASLVLCGILFYKQ